MHYDGPTVQPTVARAPTLTLEHTRDAFTPWAMPEKDEDALAQRFAARVGRSLPRGIRWDPADGALLIAADAPHYDTVDLLNHFDFVWWEEFDLYTNELERRQQTGTNR